MEIKSQYKVDLDSQLCVSASLSGNCVILPDVLIFLNQIDQNRGTKCADLEMQQHWDV